MCSGQQKARDKRKPLLQKQAQPPHCPPSSSPPRVPELSPFTFFLLISSISMHLGPFNAPSRAKPSSECASRFTFSTSISQLWSIAGKPTHPADGPTLYLRPPMPSGLLLRSGSPSLLPWFAQPPVFLSNDRSSPGRM